MRQWLKDLAVRAIHEMGGELKQMGAQGAHELASAMFNNSAFVMYPRGTHDDAHQQPEQAQIQENGREM